jgi:GT2 family glycosyltransferase
MNKSDDLTIIILNYNTPEWVEKCLSSLEKFVIPTRAYQIKVKVVDNGSAVESLKAVTEIVKKFSFAELQKISENLGFAGGNNVALKEAKSQYVMLLNSDTEATVETHFDKLIEYMNSHTHVAVITPRVELNDGNLDWASHRGEPTPWASLTYFSGLEKIFPKIKVFSNYHQTYKNLQETHEIDACSGAAMIIRTSAMEKVGYLDERFFMYAEDLDWCKRFRDEGYKIVYFPDSIIVHHKYKSGRKHSDSHTARKTSHHFYDTMLQYFDKHYQEKYPRFVRQLIQLFIHLKKGAV